MRIREEKNCRICGGDLKRVLDLGNIYPSAFLKPDEEVNEDQKAPLILDKCTHCGLVQLEHTIDLDLMYRQYWYASSLNKSMVSSLKDVVNDIQRKIVLKENDTVLDIGCNDGTMLGMYPENVIKVGYDPSLNLKRTNDFIFVNDYFNTDMWRHDKAKVITAIAMFYDLPDPNKFVEDVVKVLHEDGIFVIQFTDLLSMIRVTAFDNICHEHLEYYRLYDVYKLLRKHGLDIIDVSYNDVNGGSVRITACHNDRYPISLRVVSALMNEENYLEKHDMEYFKKNIETTITKVKEILEWSKWHDQKIFLMGASTKGNTLLQVCGITSDKVPYAAEINKEKFGLRTAGSNIEIISEDEALIKHPNQFLVPVWHFKESLLSNQRVIDYLASNGKLIFPLPYFHIVFYDKYTGVKEIRI